MLMASEELRRLKDSIAGKKLSLAIATPTYNMSLLSPYKMSSDATLRLLWELGIECTTVDLPGESYIEKARNTLITTLHKSKQFTHILFIDSDMSWEPMAVVVMLLADKELIGGAYPSKNNWKEWGVAIQTEDGIPIGDASIPLIRANQVPGGFLMISMKGIDRLVEKCPDNRYWSRASADTKEEEFYDFFSVQKPQYEDGKKRFQGEDVSFMHLFRGAGGEIWLYPNITFGHYGIKRWEGNYHEYLMKLPGGKNNPQDGSKPVETMPLVSIVIPCYNYAHFLPDAIESALNQTYPNVEIIVVDDGSADDTVAVARQYPEVTVISRPNGGLSSARNAGIRLSKGEWVCCLDADDKYHPQFLEKCLEVPNVDIISTSCREFGIRQNLNVPMFQSPTYEDFLEANCIHCASLFKKKVWEVTGGFAEDICKFGYEDWQYWLSAARHGFKIRALDDELFFYRKHGHSMIDRAEQHHDMLKAQLIARNT